MTRLRFVNKSNFRNKVFSSLVNVKRKISNKNKMLDQCSRYITVHICL